MAADRDPLSFVAAAALAVPVGALVWFELVYLWFGVTGEDPVPAINRAAFLIAFTLAFGWPLYRTRRPAEVVQQSCRLGLVVTVLLPVVAFAVLFLWESASGRRDLGMGGLMLYNVPFVALGAAVLLSILFLLGSRLAGRRIEREQ